MWTEREKDKTQLRGVCARKIENDGYVTKNANTSNVFLSSKYHMEHIKL
jgi:hypothetical protein